MKELIEKEYNRINWETNYLYKFDRGWFFVFQKKKNLLRKISTGNVTKTDAQSFHGFSALLVAGDAKMIDNNGCFSNWFRIYIYIYIQGEGDTFDEK
ncbi:MAG: hypothetical protein ACI90V_002666 [Bacillariaceae sp.]|jgi:hypothetical protein